MTARRTRGEGRLTVVDHHHGSVGAVSGLDALFRHAYILKIRRRSQGAKAEVCKTSIRRFESARRLHVFRRDGRDSNARPFFFAHPATWHLKPF